VGDLPGHEFHGNQWTGGGNDATSSHGDWAKKGGWPTTEAEFDSMSVDPKASLYSEGERIDRLPPEAPLIVYHATDAATAEHFLKEGIDTDEKPSNLARERFEAGEYAEFAPGRGVGAGLYVGGTPQGVEGYGRVLLAIRTTKGALEASPESKEAGNPTPGHALVGGDGAMIRGKISPSLIREIGERGRYPSGKSWDLKGWH